MRDLNFFEPYLFVEQKAEEKKPLYTLLKVIFLVLVVAVPAGLFGMMLLMRSDMARMEAELSSPAMQEKLKRIEAKQEKLQRLRVIQPILAQADTTLKTTDYVDDRLLQAIAAAVPQNLVLNRTIVGIEDCEIVGIARNKSAVAELVYNLRQSDLFDSIMLEDMVLIGEDYEFTVTFAIKGVQRDETDKKRN